MSGLYSRKGVLAPEPLEAGLERRQLGAVLVRAEIAERQQLLRRGRPELGVVHGAPHGEGQAVEHGAGHPGRRADAAHGAFGPERLDAGH